MPLFQFRGRVFDQRYQSRYGERGSFRADWNQGCLVDVWLTTRSTITRMPICSAWFMNSTNSPSVPCLGCTS